MSRPAQDAAVASAAEPREDGRRHKSDRQRAVASARMKRLWQDPAFAARSAAKASERMAALNRSAEARARASERMAAYNADPAHKEVQRAHMTALQARPEFRARHAERMAGLNRDPEFKARQRAAREKRAAARTAAFSGGRPPFEPLPLMSIDEWRVFKRLRRDGVDRDTAAREALVDRNRRKNEAHYG